MTQVKLPNYPDEIVEWTKKLRDAQYALINFNEKDPSNYLDKAHMEEILQRLHDSAIHASSELEKWSKHYSITYDSLKFDQLQS